MTNVDFTLDPVTGGFTVADRPLAQFLFAGAGGTGTGGTTPPPTTTPTTVIGSSQTLINGVITGAPLQDTLGRIWTLTAGPPPDVLMNGVGNWTSTNLTNPPTELLLGSDGKVYMQPADGPWKLRDPNGTWYNGSPPTAPTAPPPLPALPPRQAIAPGTSGKVITCGPGQAIATLADAIATAALGDTINVMPGIGTLTDIPDPHAIGGSVLIDLGGNTWDGTGEDPSLPFSGAGLFVAQDGADVVMQNGTITNVGMSRTGGDNTSAIRVETAWFTGKNLVIHDNQNSVGTGDANAVIELIDCNIFHNGLLVNTGALTHNIYVNARRLTLTNTNSTNSVEGYAVKSRGPEFIVNGGTFSSSPNAKPFDLPNGTTVPFTITGATILKGANDGDHGIMSYGEEGASNGTAGGTISGGSIAALCQSPIITAPNGGVITINADVVLTGNQIAGQPSSAVVIK
jgi:hypothetical protein